MKINTESGIDKINSEFIQKDLKRIKQSEDQIDNKSSYSEDKVEISSKALDLRSLQAAAMNTTEIREEKVAALKDAVDKGTYSFSPEELADRIIEDNLTA